MRGRTGSALYLGSVVHARRDIHAQRTFRYPLFVAALDLDELPALDRTLRLFSHNRRNLFSLHDRDYAAAGDLRRHHTSALAAHGLPTPHAVRLVTNLRVVGYTFNPVSFFLGYAADGELTSVIAEVNNTYGGRHAYVLGPADRIPGNANSFRTPRTLFVSPFLHGHATYDFVIDAPLDGAAFAITMHVTADGSGPPRSRRVLTAQLAGRRRPLTDRALVAAAMRYPLMTLQVIGLIHFEALKLHIRGVPYRRPGPEHRPLVDPAIASVPLDLQ